MDRSDLTTDEAKPIVKAINDLIKTLYSKNLYMTNWYGNLPREGKIELNIDRIKYLIKKILKRTENKTDIANRGIDYEPLCNSADDSRIPWYLYWEIFWVIKNSPQLKSDMRILDAGGTSSLFTCYLASLGYEIHSIDINEKLVSNGNKLTSIMGWNMFSYTMNMKNLDFEDEYFDHAYSICVFEHLDYNIKQSALNEITRCLKPNGILSITFDYRNPAPAVAGFGPDPSQRNQLKTKKDITRNFLSTEHLELVGNQEFYDNGKSYLVHPHYHNAPYTFGSIFLKKKS